MLVAYYCQKQELCKIKYLMTRYKSIDYISPVDKKILVLGKKSRFIFCSLTHPPTHSLMFSSSGFATLINPADSPCYVCGTNCAPERILRFPKKRPQKSENRHSCTGVNCYNRVQGIPGNWSGRARRRGGGGGKDVRITIPEKGCLSF